jgi:hypothetical protein
MAPVSRTSVVIAFATRRHRGAGQRDIRTHRVDCGAVFGAWAMTVASTLPTSQPAANARPKTCRSSARLSAPPSRIGIRKMPADVAQRQRPEDRVGDRMQQHIGIRMPG